MGGAEALLVALTSQQVKHGHSVRIVTLIKPNVDFNVAKARAAGVEVVHLKEGGSCYDLRLIFRIIPYFKDCDVVNVHLTPAIHWAGLAKMLSCSKVPMVVTIHSTNGHKKLDKAFRAIDRFFYKHYYKEVIACADKVNETFCGRFPGLKVSTIPNGVDISGNIEAEPYTKQELCGVSEDVFLVTMVARFAWMKRQDTVVEAISKLPEKFNAVFVGGDGGEMQRVKNLCRELKVEDRMHFLGLRSDVPRILKTSDVNVMSSDFEGLSISSIEGMASGKPFVASDVNGLREVVGGVGALFENKNSVQLAEVLLRLEEDKNYYEQIAASCRNEAMKYDIKECCENYMTVYNRISNL